MIVILDELVYLVPEEDNAITAAKELAEHLDEPLTKGVRGYLIADEPVEFRRTTAHTYSVRCLGPTRWNM